MAKSILCYGDSNTYGYNPANGMRYPSDVRWTGRLQTLLGNGYKVIEEGCNGRTTVYDDPDAGWQNGLEYLKPCLDSHKPVDLVILMLGGNDLKETFHASAEEIAGGVEKLVEVIQSFTEEKQGFVPEMILVSPPEVGDGIEKSAFNFAFTKSAIGRSKEFPKYYKQVAERKGCVFFNAAEYVEPSELDSLHLMPEKHEVLAKELYKVINEVMKSSS